MKILDVTEKYLYERNLAHQTEINYRFVARLYVNDMKITEMQKITYDSLILWREKIFARSSSPSTWNSYLRHMQILIKYAASSKIIKKAPSASLLYAPVYFEKPKVVPLNDLRNIIQYLKSEDSAFRPNWFWAIVVRTLFYTGMRRRQLAGLQWKDVNLNERTIDLTSKTSKTKRSWCIPAPNPVMMDLEQLRRRTLELVDANQKFEERFVFDVKLFNSNYKCVGHINESTISNFFKRLSCKSGVKVSAHRMRHTMATELATEGKYKELQHLLGHMSVRTTMKYIHPEIAQIRVLVDTLAEIGI